MNKPYGGNRNTKIQRMTSGILIVAAISLGGCATTGVTEQPHIANKADPEISPRIYPLSSESK